MQFVANHGKSYGSTEEFGVRFSRWLRADEYIVRNNADPTSTHVAGHNHMSDYTEAEFEKMMGVREDPQSDLQAATHQVTDEKLSSSKNWTGKCSTAVKN